MTLTLNTNVAKAVVAGDAIAQDVANPSATSAEGVSPSGSFPVQPETHNVKVVVNP